MGNTVASPTRKRKINGSQPHGSALWAFLADNPELAASLAFEVGYLAGKLTTVLIPRTKKRSTALGINVMENIPHLSQLALKYLPAAVATLQPQPAPVPRRVRRPRRPRQTK